MKLAVSCNTHKTLETNKQGNNGNGERQVQQSVGLILTVYNLEDIYVFMKKGAAETQESRQGSTGKN